MPKLSTFNPVQLNFSKMKNRTLAYSLILSVAIWNAPQARAQTKKPAPTRAPLPSPSQGNAVGSARYVAGPDDVLTITVLKHPEFSASSVAVPQNGLITLPVVGTIRATGKTLEQLDAQITQGLKVKLRSPEVTVTLEKPRPRPLYVVGEVNKPGIYEAKNGWRITQALAAAGGLSVNVDLSAVIVNRNNQKLVDTSLLPLLKDPTNPGNIVLQSGDSVRFYERKVTVSVTGAVTTPGIYAVPIGSGIVQAVGFAGGSTTDAALTRASVRRANGQIVPVNLYKALLQGDTDSNIALVEGDVIVVPEQKERVSVLGAVDKPGFFPMQDGRDLKVSDAIALAGGPKPNAALTRGLLRHSDGTTQPINLYNLLVAGVQTDNVALRSDDTISIPEARGITVIGEVTNPGSYPLEEGKDPHVSDAVAAAGGLKVKPELARISVSRVMEGGKNVSMEVDPVGLLELRDLSQNARLQDGDIVSVTAIKRSTVSISGEVKTPGSYELSEGDGVAELVSRAGGSTTDAALGQISIKRRNGTISTVNASAALLEGGALVGGTLKDGDVVVVPRSTARVLIVGAVSKPGSYAMPEDRTLTVGDALSLAGGTLNTARVKTVTLLRPQNDEKTVVSTDLILDKPNKDGRLSVNIPLTSGDVLYVPEGKPRQSTLDNIARFLPFAYILR